MESLYPTAAGFTQLPSPFPQNGGQQYQEALEIIRNSCRSSPSRKRLNPSPFNRQPLTENNVAVGSIVFLPHYEASSELCECVFSDCKKKKLDKRGYNHPAVILHMQDTRLERDILTFCCIISANPQPDPLEELRGIPISLTQEKNVPMTVAGTTSPEVMYLENNGSMYKKSYIQINHVYAIPLSKLHTFSHKPLKNRLSCESYYALMDTLNLVPSNWIETSELVISGGLSDGTHTKTANSTLTNKTFDFEATVAQILRELGITKKDASLKHKICYLEAFLSQLEVSRSEGDFEEESTPAWNLPYITAH